MKVWIDIDNPPQVQYLVPFVEVFARRGFDVLVTARDYGITTELLAARAMAHVRIGREFGASRGAKVRGTVGRALHLVTTARRGGAPVLLLSTSRSAAMAAWIMRIPSFMVLDYEHAELSSFRAFGTTILHPDVIDAAAFQAKGFNPDRLVPFDGIKEDITFAGRDTDAVVPHDFGSTRDGVALVLVRPPSETSHYYDVASRDLTHGVLARLSGEPAVQVVFSPRHTGQVDALRSHRWTNEPIVLERPVEFVSLLNAVDWVIAAGGTMLREAAYLGVPAISIFRSQVGAVDQLLTECGALRLVERPEEVEGIDWRKTRRERRVPHHPEVVEELADRMVALAAVQGGSARLSRDRAAR